MYVDYGLISCLNSMNVAKREQLYSIIMRESSEIFSVDEIAEILRDDFNFQSSIKTLKKERKNV